MATQNPKHQKALAWAIGEIGVKEDPPGKNTGPRVREYQSQGTWLSGTGWAWCAAFANLAVIRGGFTGLDRTAGAWDALARAAKKGWAVQPEHHAKAIPGDLVVFSVGSGHVSVLERPVSGAIVETVDGNASDQVKRCQRPLSSVKGFICWPEDGSHGGESRKPLGQVVGGESGRRKLVVGPVKVPLPAVHDKVT